MSATKTTKKDKKTGYFKGVRSETKKISWPSKKEVINYTVVVIVMVLISALVIGALDFVFNQMFRILS